MTIIEIENNLHNLVANLTKKHLYLTCFLAYSTQNQP